MRSLGGALLSCAQLSVRAFVGALLDLSAQICPARQRRVTVSRQ